VPQLVSTVYPTTPHEEPSIEALRHNTTKLLMARLIHLDTDPLRAQIDDKQEKIYVTQIKRWAENIQTR
jgi:hypothetical protein